MRTICKRTATETAFIIADLDPAYHEAARHLMYAPVEEGFAKVYPCGTPDLDHIYGNFMRYAEAIVMQAAGVVHVPPLDLQLEVSRRRGLAGRIELIQKYLEQTRI